MPSLGERVRHLRQAKGLTQSQLAGTELTKGFISLLERGKTRPSLDSLLIISKRLETSVDALLSGEGHVPAAVADSLLGLIQQATDNREFSRAAKLLEMVAYLAAEYGVEEAARETELQLGSLEFTRTDYPAAWAHLERARQLAEAVGDPWRRGRALFLMGWVKVREREYPSAMPLLQQALHELKRAHASRDPARAEVLIILGTTLIRLGRYAVALRRFQEAARSDTAKRNAAIRGRALWGVGWSMRKLGRLEESRVMHLQAKEALEAAEELADLMRVLQSLGQLEMERGRVREGLKHLQHALRVMERLGKEADRAAILNEIGRAHLMLGQLDAAESYVTEALHAAERAKDRKEIAEAKLLLARAGGRSGDVKAAVRLFKEASELYQAQGMRDKVKEAARELGMLLRRRGAHAEAVDVLAFAFATEKPDRYAVDSGIRVSGTDAMEG